ncbi:MAG: MFS transporter [Chloroflexota bacterium]
MSHLAALRRGWVSTSPDVRWFYLFNLMAFVAWGVLGLDVNLYLRELGLNEEAMGIFAAVQTLAMAAAGVAMGPLFHRIGVWATLVVGLVLFAVASLALALVSGFWALLALGVLTGFGISALFTGTMPMIIDLVPANRRASVSTVAFALIGLSFTLGSLLGGLLPTVLPLAPLGSYRWTIAISAVIAGISLVTLLKIDRIHWRPAPKPEHHESPKPDVPPTSGTRRDTFVAVLVSGLLAAAFGALLPFYNVYLVDLGMATSTIGLVCAAGGFAQAVVGLTAPAWSRRLGSIWTVSGLRLAPVPFFAALVLMPSLGLASIAYIARAGFFGPTVPAESTFIADFFPPKVRSHVFGLRFASWNLGWALASGVAGVLIVSYGYNPVILLFVGFTIAANVLNALYFGRHPAVVSGEVPGALPPARGLAAGGGE